MAEEIETDKRGRLFNRDWATKAGTADETLAAALSADDWQAIDLPHDYSIGQPFDERNEAESGFLPGGVQWYRKEFLVPEALADKRFVVVFDGVYMNATVYLNGHALGTHPYGYTPFAFDLTEFVSVGATNTLAVRVDHEIPSSRWYSGSGIYRDVTLVVTDAVHVAYRGTVVTAPNLAETADGEVRVDVTSRVQNDDTTARDVTVQTALLTEDGTVVAESEPVPATLAANATEEVAAPFTVARPHLWSVDDPYCYRVQTTVSADDGQVLDRTNVTYGFRYYSFSPSAGFSLNGVPLKLKGVSMHHDQGALGAVTNPHAVARQLRLLKEMGANAIRSTHNPASRVLLDLADHTGFLIIDEAFDGWTAYKNGNVNDYTKHFNETIAEGNQIIGGVPGMRWGEFDTKAMVLAARNDPAVILWSIGNEIFNEVTGPVTDYPRIGQAIISWIRALDTTRPLTIGDNNQEKPLADPINAALVDAGGVVGKNYANAEVYAAERAAHSDYAFYGSETASAIHSRGIYTTLGIDETHFQLSEYDTPDAVVPWGHPASDAWRWVIENDWNAGSFSWTGFDYIGEPTPWNNMASGSKTGQGPLPKSSYFGILDTAGFPKDTYYFYRSVWRDDAHTLHVMPSWNQDEIMIADDGTVRVDVFTDASKVALFLNGEKVAEETATVHETPLGYHYLRFSNDNAYPTFHVPYAPGQLVAKAYDANGTEITDAAGRNSVYTHGPAAALMLSVDRPVITADGVDLAYVTVDVVDADGHFVSNADTRIQFSVDGPGRLVGVDNGDPTDTDAYKGTTRKAFSGKALAIVQATATAGTITLTATADGLASQTIEIEAQDAHQAW